MTGRSLSFASLLLTAVQPAFAGGMPVAPVSQAATIPEVQSLTALQARWNLSIRGGELVADLILINTSAEAVDIVSARGHSPGPYVSAILGENTLSQVLTGVQERDMMSRMGPMPTYAAIAPGKEFVAGTYRFTLPANYAGSTVHLEATVRGAKFDSQKLQLDVQLDPKKAA